MNWYCDTISQRVQSGMHRMDERIAIGLSVESGRLCHTCIRLQPVAVRPIRAQHSGNEFERNVQNYVVCPRRVIEIAAKIAVRTPSFAPSG